MKQVLLVVVKLATALSTLALIITAVWSLVAEQPLIITLSTGFLALFLSLFVVADIKQFVKQYF